jgi:hypothetical protein
VAAVRRRLTTRAAAALATVALAALLGAGGAGAAAGDLVLVADTEWEAYGEEGNLHHRPAISADGRFVAYVAQASFKEQGDPLFLRDMRNDTTVKVVQSLGNSNRSSRDTSAPVLSDSGRYLAFTSEDPDLSTEDEDIGRFSQVQDVFVYDRATGKVRLVSRRRGPHGRAGDSDSSLPSISADGRYVAYGTESSNLWAGPGLIVGGVFERDLRTEANRLLAGVPGIEFWVPSVFSPDISGDGRRIAYGFEYSPTPINGQMPDAELFKLFRQRRNQIMLTDPEWKRPHLVSRAAGPHGPIANENCREPSTSRSGRFVAFVSDATNLVPGDENGVEDVFVRDVERGRTTLVSRIGIRGPEGDEDSSHPSISADGRYVAFQTHAANLSPGDPDDRLDVYVRDLLTGRLTLVSRGLRTEPSTGSSGVPTITPSGRFIAFASSATNLSPENTSDDLAFYRFEMRPAFSARSPRERHRHN